MTLDPSTLPPSYLSAVSTAANMGINPNGHMRNPVSSLYNHTNMAAAAAVNASPSAFALMGAHQQHQLLQARMAASNLAMAANAASAAAAAASIGSSTSPGSTISSPDEKNSSTSSSSGGDTPMSRTNQYKKIMKPLLERKRRARINKCLDELKDIMTVALQAQGENVSKLEKADILELTVRHLHKLSASQRLLLTSPPQQRNPLEEVQRFQAGYSSCAQEAASFLLTSPGVDVTVSQRLLSHLSSNLSNPVMAAAAAAAASSTAAASAPVKPASSSPTSTTGLHSPPPLPVKRLANRFEPPPRPSSNPVGGTTLETHFTVAIAKSVGDEESEEEEAEDGLRPVLKPEAIRLNPNDNMWRPF